MPNKKKPPKPNQRRAPAAGANASTPSEFLTSTEVAGLLRISKRTLQRLCARGAITYIEFSSGKFLFRRVAVEAFVAARTIYAKTITLNCSAAWVRGFVRALGRTQRERKAA